MVTGQSRILRVNGREDRIGPGQDPIVHKFSLYIVHPDVSTRIEYDPEVEEDGYGGGGLNPGIP